MVLFDEYGFGQDELDALCYGLVQAHQIVTKSVPLAAPFYGHTRWPNAQKNASGAHTG